jgi:hypothetical protein
MSLVTSNEILLRVNTLLNDTAFVRWPKLELLDYLNDAQRAIVLRRPDAYCADIDNFKCVAGTKQSLPADALRLIDIPRNSTGRSIKGPYDRIILDDSYPEWYAGNSASVAELYIYDERNPKTFYLYPGVLIDTELTVVYSKAPPSITLAESDGGALMELDDIFVNATIEWVLYRAYMKDAEYAANANKSQMHLNAFKTQLGEKSQADGAMASEVVRSRA